MATTLSIFIDSPIQERPSFCLRTDFPAETFVLASRGMHLNLLVLPAAYYYLHP
jgi:hypothetical protein